MQNKSWRGEAGALSRPFAPDLSLTSLRLFGSGDVSTPAKARNLCLDLIRRHNSDSIVAHSKRSRPRII